MWHYGVSCDCRWPPVHPFITVPLIQPRVPFLSSKAVAREGLRPSAHSWQAPCDLQPQTREPNTELTRGEWSYDVRTDQKVSETRGRSGRTGKRRIEGPGPTLTLTLTLECNLGQETPPFEAPLSFGLDACVPVSPTNAVNPQMTVAQSPPCTPPTPRVRTHTPPPSLGVSASCSYIKKLPQVIPGCSQGSEAHI